MVFITSGNYCKKSNVKYENVYETKAYTMDTLRVDYFYDESNNLYAIKYNSNMYYYIRNAQNDIISIVDSTGTKVVEYAYNTWGKVMSTTGTMADTLGQDNPFRYRGYYYDTESGLYYLQSRYYDPVTYRFLNADGQFNNDLLGKNLFSYCFNNPVKHSDPSGNVAGIDDLAIAFFVVMGFIGVGLGGVALANQPMTQGSSALAYDFPTLPKLELLPKPKEKPNITVDVLPKPKEEPSNPRPKGKYYDAYLLFPGIAVSLSNAMNADQAKATLLSGGDVWTYSEKDAKALAIYASGGYVSGISEKNVCFGKDAFHYHLKNRKAGVHIFYGQQGLDLVSSC